MALDRCDGVLATGSPAALRCGAYDCTGAVAAAGSYAFLTDDDAVFTTYEGLHDGTATRLLIHTTDAGGTSHTASFDAVQAGDIRFHADAVGVCGGFAAERPAQPVPGVRESLLP